MDPNEAAQEVEAATLHLDLARERLSEARERSMASEVIVELKHRLDNAQTKLEHAWDLLESVDPEERNPSPDPPSYRDRSRY